LGLSSNVGSIAITGFVGGFAAPRKRIPTGEDQFTTGLADRLNAGTRR
jgi:hypothetical protein